MCGGERRGGGGGGGGFRVFQLGVGFGEFNLFGGQLGDGSGSRLLGSLGRLFQNRALLLQVLGPARVLGAVHLGFAKFGLGLRDALLEIFESRRGILPG